MSLEPPSLRPPMNPSSTPISRIPSPSPSFNTILMAAVATTNTAPQSNPSVGLAVPPSGSTPTTPPSDEWSRSRSPNPAGAATPNDEASGIVDSNAADVDPQIIEALRSKDRLYVLKLGELMEGLINERKARIDLTPSTSYQRLLVHRCSAFYKLSPESDSATKSIIVSLTAESRIPTRRLSELVPAESSAQPAFKIMRRTANERIRSKPHTPAGSVAGEDADLSDAEPSESGSFGGRSSATGTNKKQRTIEEREAAYNEARSRIFMDFQEKEKEKEKDMSASSSTQSLISGSASTSGGRRSSSIDDLDDSVGTPATESEWSGPVTRERKDLRHTGSSNNVAGSSRSLRSNAPPFNANGSSSSRGSRSSSPAFKYASLYEPPPATAMPYDAAQAAGKAPPFIPHFQYGYQTPAQTPHNQQTYPAAYPNFTPYSYPPQNQMPSSDAVSPVGQDVYMSSHHQTPSQYVQYPNPYLWPNAHQPSAVSLPVQHPSTPSHHQHQPSNHPHTHLQPTQSAPQFSAPYMQPTPPYGPYPITGYYPPQPGQQQMPPPHPHMMGQSMYSPESRSMNGIGGGAGRNGHDNAGASNHSRTSSRNSTGHGAMNGGGKRGAPPARTAWSYGPGIGIGGLGYGNSSAVGGEAVGPRLSSAMRRTSQTSSVGSGSTGYRTPAGDEASSTASSSTTSSSSRRTYTSTASSQHPLPPRPDWAVGLKPQPTLHATHPRHHDHAMSGSRSSPARHGSQSQASLHSPSQQITPIVLQSTDFPPLTTLSSPPEKRTPILGGAWTNASSTRSILMPSPGHANSQSGTLSPNSNASNTGRLEEPERGFERPPPKGSVELFNPKGSRRSNSSNSRHNSIPQDKSENEKQAGDVIANVVDQVTSLSIGDRSPGSPPIKAAAPVATLT